MASACLFFCPRAKLRSLLQDSPAAGLGIVSPSVKARTGGSANLMNFYATSYAVAYGQPRLHPHLGHHTSTGYVSNNHSAISCLLCPRGAAKGHCQDTATSTTTEHFKPFWLPDGRSLLPRHVHQPERPPRASREHGTESRRAGPAQPDVLQKTTIGAKEQSGFTRATLRSDSILPVLPAQPLGVSITAMDYLPSVRSHCGETLPALPAGSKRGNGFSQEVPGSLGTVGPLEFTINHGQYVTPHPNLSPAAPAWCSQGPTWMVRPMGGIQPQRPSGFSTNNHPTGHLLVWPPQESQPQR